RNRRSRPQPAAQADPVRACRGYARDLSGRAAAGQRRAVLMEHGAGVTHPLYPDLETLLTAVRACRACEQSLPLGPRPVLHASATARILIVGQAPGARVHASGIPWDDASGDRLRAWMGVEKDAFYDEKTIAIVPMGYCYPGRGQG